MSGSLSGNPWLRSYLIFRKICDEIQSIRGAYRSHCLNSYVCQCDERDPDCTSIDRQMNPFGYGTCIYDGSGRLISPRISDFEKSYEDEITPYIFWRGGLVYDSLMIFL